MRKMKSRYRNPSILIQIILCLTLCVFTANAVNSEYQPLYPLSKTKLTLKTKRSDTGPTKQTNGRAVRLYRL